MRIFVRSFRGEKVPVDIHENIRVIDLKWKLIEITRDHHYRRTSLLSFGGQILYDDQYLSYYDIEDGDVIEMKGYVVGGGPEPENNDCSTNIHAVNKRENIGKQYFYRIKGSNEGTVWGDHIYTDDSNIAKASVLEGKCQLGEETIVGIEMIEGKSSYSSADRNGVSSVTYGSWPASYKFYWLMMYNLKL